QREYPTGTLNLPSTSPLGFIRVLKKFATLQTYMVYPKPEGDHQLPLSHMRSQDSGLQAVSGEGDDFAGVRAYVTGESQRHIDWKAVARGQPLMTKQFAPEAEGAVYLDFSDLRSAAPLPRPSPLSACLL